MTRIVSAAVLAAVLFGTVWLLPWWATAVLAAVAAALATREVNGIAAAAGVKLWTPTEMLAVGVVVRLVFQRPNAMDAVGWPVLMAVVVGAGLLRLAAGPPSPSTFTRFRVLAVAPFYVGLPLGALASIARTNGPGPLTWMIVLIAASDSAQYYSGRAFGRHKLAPSVSPAKTVEGAIGGLVVATLVAVVAGLWWLPGVGPAEAALLGLLLAAFGMAGDLFESLLKRSAGVKDSSTIIPGHGGVLDRLDSYLFAAPCFYIFLRYVQ